MPDSFSARDSSILIGEAQNPYPYTQIWINGRRAAVEKIADGSEPVGSPFEDTTFRFIRAWLAGEEAFAMTTSGSTGPPKPVVLSRTQMIRSALLTARHINLRKDSTALLCIDPRYIGGKMMLVRSLVLGLPITAIDPVSNPLISIPVDMRIQLAALVPYQVQSILESKHPHLLNNLGKVLIGGAALSAATRQKLEHFQCECYETYGMTETISHIALRLVNTRSKQPYFQVLPGVQVSLDERGCLVINADHLGEAVVTNDIVEIVDIGKFVWLGRWDNVINSGAVKVFPEEVERQLEHIFLENGFHQRFFIAALPDEKLGNKVTLIIEGVHFSSEILNRSLDQLRSALTAYEVPREIYSVPEFESTETQKVDRKQTIARMTFTSPLKP